MRYAQKRLEKETEDKEVKEDLFKNITKSDSTFNEITDLINKALEYYVESSKDIGAKKEKLKEKKGEIESTFGKWLGKTRLFGDSPLKHVLETMKEDVIDGIDMALESLNENAETLNIMSRVPNALQKKLSRLDEEIKLRDEVIEYMRGKKELEAMVVKV